MSVNDRADMPQDLTRLVRQGASMRLPDGPAAQQQRSTRWFAKRLDGTLLDCGLEGEGYKNAIFMLLVWEANGQ